MKHLLTLIFALGLMASVATTKAAAQAPPMNMSWGIQSQMMYQAHGDYMARTTAMAYYNYMLRLRAMGYTGPSLPTGVTPQSLQASMQRLQQSYDAFNASSAWSSNVRSNAAANYDMRAIRGCSTYVDAYGQTRWYCP